MERILDILNDLFNLLTPGRARLRTYEAGVLECLKERLSPTASDMLTSQLRRVQLVQRWGPKKVVFFYSLRRDPPAYPGGERCLRIPADLPRFPNESPVLYAATVALRPAAGKPRVLCDVIFDEGRLWSLEFNRSPRPLLDKGFEVVDVILRADLMEPARARQPLSTPGSVLQGIMGKYAVTDALAPAPDAERTAFLQRLKDLEIALPEDFLTLLAETDGFHVNDRQGTPWEFYGTRARRIPHPWDSYWLVFEEPRSIWALGFREGERQPKVFLLNQIDEEEREVGDQLLPAMLRLLGQPPAGDHSEESA